MTGSAQGRVLLTGATGFVGRAVLPRLLARGWQVRCFTRDVKRAAARRPELDWVKGDVQDEQSLRQALAGCQAALYLVHSMGEGPSFADKEIAAARSFARAAAHQQVGRIVYLGGLAPIDHASSHLRSRLAVGEVLRAGPTPALELRASMIVGHGSLSWLIVRDLAARLPVMLLPSWLRSRTQPVAIDDVVVALGAALELPVSGSASFDLPGPQVMSCREILEQTARMMSLPPPRMVEVPVLTPRLSSHWVHFVTRAHWAVAREVVVGLTEDLLARDDRFWKLSGHTNLLSFPEAARRALAEDSETASGTTQSAQHGAWGMVERLRGGKYRRSVS